jgi:predicted dehydrogenase
MRVAIVGAGRVAQIHGAGLRAVEGVSVTAVVDPRAEAAAALAEVVGGAKPLSDVNELFDRDDIDAVDIALPHDLHYPVAKMSLLAAKHVFMDKPLALTAAEGKELVELARERDLRFMLCHNLLFHSAVIEAGEYVKQGRIGRVTTADSWSSGWLDLMPWDFRLSREKAGGGAWFDNGPHLLYVLQDWLGPITDVVALAARGESRIGGEDACVAAVRHADGGVSTARISYADRLPGHEDPWPAGWTLGFEVRGTSGYVRCEVVPHPTVTTYDGTGAPRKGRIATRFEAAFDAAIAEFVDAVRMHRDPSVTGEDSLQILELIERAYRQ